MFSTKFVDLLNCHAGNVSIGLSGAETELTGTDNVFIGTSTSINGTTAQDCILVGSSATLNDTSPSNAIIIGHNSSAICTGNCIAIGSGAVVQTPNSIVLGSHTAGIAIRETGIGHQYMWTMSIFNSTATLTGTDVLNGWVAFEEATSPIVECYLPTFTSLSEALPNVQNGTTRELIISNFSASEAYPEVRFIPPDASSGPGNPNEVHISSDAQNFPQTDYLPENTLAILRCVYLASGTFDGYWEGPCYVFYI